MPQMRTPHFEITHARTQNARRLMPMVEGLIIGLGKRFGQARSPLASPQARSHDVFEVS